MILNSISVYNYKSFAPEGQSLELGSGFNVLFGQNNAGKTALLEAIALQIENKQHRSRLTVPEANSPANLGESHVEFTVLVEAAELWPLLRQSGHFYIPLPRVREAGLDSHEPGELLRFCQWALDQQPMTVRYIFRSGSLLPARSRSFGLYEAQTTQAEQVSAAVCTVDPVQNRLNTATASATHRNNELGNFVASTLRSRLYLFKAERRIARSNLTASEELAPDASNLAAVLNRLQANPAKFQRFSRLVQQVFPAIQAISVRPSSTNELEVLAWFDEPDY